jgi:hypothetical protein
MKKTSRKPVNASASESDMRPEYDFRGGTRGKHYRALREGYTIRIYKSDGTVLEKRVEGEGTVTLAPDVREYFPNSKAVNRALRTLISLVPEKRKAVAQRQRSPKNGRRLTAKSRATKLR